MNHTHIFIDDERVPEQVTWLRLPRAEWTIVRSIYCWRLVLNQCRWTHSIEVVSFDFDMGLCEPAGTTFLDELLHTVLDGMKMPKVYFHTMNPVGRDSLERTLESFERFRNRYCR